MKRSAYLLGVAIATWCVQTDANAAEPTYDRPYGAYDAIRDGAASSDDRQQALVEQQIDTVNRLNTYAVPDDGLITAPAVVDVAPRAQILVGRGGPVLNRLRGAIGIQRPQLASPYGSDPNGYRIESRVTARQPIGRQEVQTGPNRWESRPVYGAVLAARGRLTTLTPPSIPTPPSAAYFGSSGPAAGQDTRGNYTNRSNASSARYTGRQIDLQTRDDYRRSSAESRQPQPEELPAPVGRDSVSADSSDLSPAAAARAAPTAARDIARSSPQTDRGNERTVDKWVDRDGASDPTLRTADDDLSMPSQRGSRVPAPARPDPAVDQTTGVQPIAGQPAAGKAAGWLQSVMKRPGSTTTTQQPTLPSNTQPTTAQSSAAQPALEQSTENSESGPLLQDPASGRREF